VVTQLFRARLEERLGAQAGALLSHPHRRLHVFTSRGRRLLHRPGGLAMALGWLAAFAANAASRRALGGWMQRVVFSDPRDPLPLSLSDYPTHQAVLTPANLTPAVLASCTIPFWLQPVQDVPGGPPGAYFDGGITDYHLHLRYADLGEGLVLYPHFGPQVVPGWLDKPWKRRHGASPALDNLVVLSPRPQWVATLPQGRLPDRSDFRRYGEDEAGRQRAWRRALAESQRLAEDFARLVEGGQPFEALPLP
jgi:hypothetical protein